jgi:hypothetical protein
VPRETIPPKEDYCCRRALWFYSFGNSLPLLRQSPIRGSIGQATPKSMTVWEKETQSPPEALPKNHSAGKEKDSPSLIPALNIAVDGDFIDNHR